MARTIAVPKAPPDVGTRALLRLAGPIFVAQLAVMGVPVIDTLMAGRLSATDLAAVAVGSSVYASLSIALGGVIQALMPIAGHHYGAGRFDEIGTDLVQALWLAVALALGGFVLLLWHDTWIARLDAPPEVARIASTYLSAVAFGLPAMLATRAFVAVNSAVSRPKITMAIQLAALAAKVPLNLIFMYGAGGLPAMGGAGCGLASAIHAWITLILAAAVFWLDAGFARYRSRLALRPDATRLGELLKLGLPIGGSLLIEVTSFTFMALFIVRFGAQTLAAHQIMANVVSVLFMLPLSLGIAAGVLAAQALGAEAPIAARRATLRGFRVAALCAAFFMAAVWLLRGTLVGAYTTDAQVAAIALDLIALICIFHGFDAFQGVAGFVLRGYKVSTMPMVIHGISLWGIGLGGGYLLAFERPFGWGANGVHSFWIAALAGIALTAAGLTGLTLRIANQHVREHAQGKSKGPE